jgi:hypothetical protein
MFNPDQDRLSAFEERLRSWQPSPGGLDRDRMLFEAGRAEAQGSTRTGASPRLWRFATAAAVLLTSGLGWAWQNERSQRRALELTVARLAPPHAAPLDPASELMAERQEKNSGVDPTSYLALVRQVKRLEPGAFLEPSRDEPRTVQKIRASNPSRTAPLRPRDFDRVIEL